MVYVAWDGTMRDKPPFHIAILAWFWGIINFVIYFFRSLINPNENRFGDKYKVDYRPPGGGPPRPPSRRFGGFDSGSGPGAPPMSSGCGCGG